MIVYKITNKINGKQYAGQTTQRLEERWRQHCSDSNGCVALKSAIDKYGKENFEIEEVDRANSLEELNKKEQEWILKLNSLAPNGYNLKTGGDRPIYSDASRKKMSDSHKGNAGFWLGKNHSQETKRKIALAKTGPKNNNFGKPKSSEVKKKISNSQANKITIVCNETGVIYPSLGMAAKDLNLHEQNIRKVLQGKRKHTKSFTFSYINKDLAHV